MVFFAVLLILQAIFARRIGAWQAQLIRHYPPFLRWFYVVFPPNSEFTASMALMAAIIGVPLCIALAVLFAYMKPVSH
jgi:hypothetical protein